MAVIYATLIVKGKKTINDVPPVIREQVKQILIDLDLPELAESATEGELNALPFIMAERRILWIWLQMQILTSSIDLLR